MHSGKWWFPIAGTCSDLLARSGAAMPTDACGPPLLELLGDTTQVVHPAATSMAYGTSGAVVVERRAARGNHQGGTDNTATATAITRPVTLYCCNIDEQNPAGCMPSACRGISKTPSVTPTRATCQRKAAPTPHRAERKRTHRSARCAYCADTAASLRMARDRAQCQASGQAGAVTLAVLQHIVCLGCVGL
jgi:hypothetical protein